MNANLILVGSDRRRRTDDESASEGTLVQKRHWFSVLDCAPKAKHPTVPPNETDKQHQPTCTIPSRITGSSMPLRRLIFTIGSALGFRRDCVVNNLFQYRPFANSLVHHKSHNLRKVAVCSRNTCCTGTHTVDRERRRLSHESMKHEHIRIRSLQKTANCNVQIGKDHQSSKN